MFARVLFDAPRGAPRGRGALGAVARVSQHASRGLAYQLTSDTQYILQLREDQDAKTSKTIRLCDSLFQLLQQRGVAGKARPAKVAGGESQARASGHGMKTRLSLLGPGRCATTRLMR